ncbi:DUF6730 family protein [Ascidiimonas aurantiaca]|uniref:DUF6730 family protein n=1 Tax=Ascidiimonas aurantiaca TaxID=1685432 RepID=UPI0030ECD6E1
MATMKEYMEVLTSEMEAFRSDVDRLEKINDQLKDTEVSIDVKEIKALLKEHQAGLERQSEQQERFHAKMESLFQRAGVYPKWAIIVFILAILLSVTSLAYVYWTKVTQEEDKGTTSIVSPGTRG